MVRKYVTKGLILQVMVYGLYNIQTTTIVFTSHVIIALIN